jgi:hypothetical protein
MEASSGGAGSASSTGGGTGIRSGKGGGEPQHQGASGPAMRPDRPPRGSGGNRTGTNQGWTDAGIASGLSQEDPDHQLRGEDQLVDGVSQVVRPGGPRGASEEE